MVDVGQFKPKTVYTIYIAAPPEEVWRALTTSELTRKYFWERSIELEPKAGGAFALHLPDGRVNVQGKVVDYDRAAQAFGDLARVVARGIQQASRMPRDLRDQPASASRCA